MPQFDFRACHALSRARWGVIFGCFSDTHMPKSPNIFCSRLRRSQTTTCLRLGFASKMSNSRAIDFAALSVSRVAFENIYGRHFGCFLDFHMSESPKFFCSHLRRSQIATYFWLHCAPKMSVLECVILPQFGFRTCLL